MPVAATGRQRREYRDVWRRPVGIFGHGDTITGQTGATQRKRDKATVIGQP